MRTRGHAANQNSPTRGQSAFSSRPVYPKEIELSHIGKRLKAERKRLHRTQEEVAEAVGLTPAFIGHIERGERSLSLDTLVKLCNYYGVTIDYLLADILPADIDAVMEQVRVLLKDQSPEKQLAILDILNAIVRNL